jgi:GMP synthase (glutamine-hydrolysing)
MSLKFLLLQARKPSDPARENERKSFARKLNFLTDQIQCHDLLEGPPSIQQIGHYDALLFGGAGDYYVSKKNLPRFEETMEFLREVVERGYPMFASCFGFHCMVEALGGMIIHDPSKTEVGTFRIKLTDCGISDPLVGSTLPLQFRAQLGRKDRAVSLPDGFCNLAQSEHAPFQAFRVPGKPIWAFQFHPELSCKENQDRFRLYMDGYAKHMSESERQEALSRFKESPETEKLLKRFLDLVF